MKTYTIKEVATLTSFSVDTLRYYDSIKLLSPQRTANNYRVYTSQDIMVCRYIKVMKHAGFTLEEIMMMMQNFGISDPGLCNGKTLPLIEQKKADKIKQLNKIVQLLDISHQTFSRKVIGDASEMDELVIDIFDGIKNEE